jgi:hypothetical protein
LSSEEQNVTLLEEISKEELKTVLSSLRKTRVQDPNRWTIEFFLGFYDSVEENLLRVIEEVKSFSKMPRNFNATFVALIPKKEKTRQF